MEKLRDLKKNPHELSRQLKKIHYNVCSETAEPILENENSLEMFRGEGGGNLQESMQ